MKCFGEFVFKSLRKREGGTFKNDKGQDVNYDEAYVLKVDEVSNDGVDERTLKIDKNNTVLLNKLQNKKPYDKINLVCDVVLYGANAKVIPIDIDSNNK